MAKKDGKIATLEIKISEMPEVLAKMRLEMARLLRTEADARWTAGEGNVVDMAVCESLRKVADAFEAGLASVADIDG